MEVLDFGYVKIAEPEDQNKWGSDENIIRAARMSTDKGFLGWGRPHKRTCPCSTRESFAACICSDWEDGYSQGDEKLLRYLWQHKHATPFEMAGLTLEIQCPIFVAREWMRHRTQSYSELSSRYTQLPDLFYIPSIERLMNGRQSTKNKQNSEEGFTEQWADSFHELIRYNSENCRATYEDMLEKGLSRELARLVIPVNQYTRFRASANLRNWLAFLTLRLAEGAQWEIRQFAHAVATLIEQEFPKTYHLFKETQNGRG